MNSTTQTLSTLPEDFDRIREAFQEVFGTPLSEAETTLGLTLAEGSIIPMHPGAARTHLAALPIVLNARAGQGAHLFASSNAQAREAVDRLGPFCHRLGLSFGLLQGFDRETGTDGSAAVYDPDYLGDGQGTDPWRPVTDQDEAYSCDITCGPATEFGFRYLRDTLGRSDQKREQRSLAYVLALDADTLLDQDAHTPLIIATSDETSIERTKRLDTLMHTLEAERDYTIQIEQKSAAFTIAGEQRLATALGTTALAAPENVALQCAADAALKAHAVMIRDVDYCVLPDIGRKAGIAILDGQTGQPLPDRRFMKCLHSALEAKEGLEVSAEAQTLASITFEELFRLYARQAGLGA